MAHRYVFADEAGNFDFPLKQGASRYFILTTVTMDDCRAGDALAQLRRDLVWQGVNLENPPHATDDPPAARAAIFAMLMRAQIRIDATVLEKRKAQCHLHNDLELYKMGWYLHFKYVGPQIVTSQDRLSVVAASLGTKKTRTAFNEAVDDVVRQASPSRYRVAFWKADSDPCLQVADYCCWAIQRSWEQGDQGPLSLMQSKVRSNTDIWARGSTYYY